MSERENTERREVPVEICDDCEIGKQNRCPHAYDCHADSWGNRIDTPEYCPDKE